MPTGTGSSPYACRAQGMEWPWEGKDGWHEADDTGLARRYGLRLLGRAVRPDDDFSEMVRFWGLLPVPHESFLELRARLVENYNWLFAQKQLTGPHAYPH